VALNAVLASPDFLFRIERDPKPAARAPYFVNEYELASRLSYFLGQYAGRRVFRAAREQSCGNREFSTQVRRMMADPKPLTWWTTLPRSGSNCATWAAPSQTRRAFLPWTMSCWMP
jgi:hypothetical protein